MSFASRRSVRVGALAMLVFLLVAAAALAATPKTGHWVGKVVQGQAVGGKAGEPTFTVSGGKIRKFTIGGVGAYCFTGYQVVSVSVPTAPIRHGHFSTTIHPIKHANVKLTGTFVSPTKVKGTVAGSGYACDYTIGFVAHRG